MLSEFAAKASSARLREQEKSDCADTEEDQTDLHGDDRKARLPFSRKILYRS
jgi:hypothetical protein